MKHLPQKEIQLLVDAMDEIRKAEEKQLAKVKGNSNTIGNF